jgi:hypothetical protein
MSSTSRKLIQAAALAAALVPLGSVAMEADSITCRFNNTGSGYYGNVGGSGCFSSTEDSSIYDFGDYSFELGFTLQEYVSLSTGRILSVLKPWTLPSCVCFTTVVNPMERKVRARTTSTCA